MEFFVELGCRLLPAIALEKIIKGITNDSQQPGTAVSAPKPAEKLEGSEIGFLDDILCVRVVTRQPSCQVIRSIHVRQDALLEPCEFILFFQRGAPRCQAIRYPGWFWGDLIPMTDFSPSAGIFRRQSGLRRWKQRRGLSNLRGTIIRCRYHKRGH